MTGKTVLAARLRRLLFLLRYYLFDNSATIARLTAYGLSEITIYRTDHWYIGDDSEKTIRKYYTANFKGERCFIKLAQNDSTIKNEIFVNRYITGCGINFVPKTLLCDEEYAGDTSLLVTQFKPYLENFKIPPDETDFEKICLDFEKIHSCFLKYGIIHGDISDSNLLLDHKRQIMLIDFGIGRVPGSEAYPIDYVAHDGNYYLTSGSDRIYDDAYSFIKMLDSCGIPPSYKQKECYRRISDLVGAHQYTVSMTLQRASAEEN